MRVLMFGWEFPPYQSGGLATATVGLVSGLVGQGAEVTLVLPFEAAESQIDGLRLIGVPQAGGADVYGDVMARVERFASAAGRVAAEREHDIIDAHDWITFGAGLHARAVSGRPLVAHIHATEYDRAGEHGHSHVHWREQDGMRNADRVIANSHALARQVSGRYGIEPSRIDVVHWGIGDAPAASTTVAATPFPADSPVVLFVGRITSQKGPGFFVDAARQIAGHVDEARFLVVGAGDLLEWMVHRVDDLGLTDRFHFAGSLAPADVGSAYRRARVTVMPSVSEPFGLVALESVRNGTPCVVDGGAGVAEVLDSALKVQHWDVDEIANHVVAVLRHDALREELREQGLRELEHKRFSLAEPARLTIEAYRRALAVHHA